MRKNSTSLLLALLVSACSLVPIPVTADLTSAIPPEMRTGEQSLPAGTIDRASFYFPDQVGAAYAPPSQGRLVSATVEIDASVEVQYIPPAPSGSLTFTMEFVPSNRNPVVLFTRNASLPQGITLKEGIPIPGEALALLSREEGSFRLKITLLNVNSVYPLTIAWRINKIVLKGQATL